MVDAAFDLHNTNLLQNNTILVVGKLLIYQSRYKALNKDIKRSASRLLGRYATVTNNFITKLRGKQNETSWILVFEAKMPWNFIDII